jgi:PAS domain S-box-containing protein
MKSSSKDSQLPQATEQEALTSGQRQQSGAADGQRADAGQLLCQIGGDGRILEANTAFCIKFHIDGEARGKNILDYVSSSERGLLARKLLLAHHHQKNYFVELQPEGAEPSAVKMQLKASKNTLYLQEVVKTPSRVQVSQVADEELIAAEVPAFAHRFEAEYIPLPVLLYNKDHQLQYANSYFLTFAGYHSREELLKLREDELFPGQEALLAQMRSTVIEGRESHVSSQLQLQMNKGSQSWVVYTFCKIPKQELYMAVLQDISQLKQQEISLSHREEEMGMFMDRAFHDLKGPLNSLIALYSLVEHEYGQDKQVMEYFLHYHEGITRLHKTLHDLLILSRIQKAEPSYKPLCLNQMVDECLQSFRNLPSFYKIRFIKKIKIKNLLLTEENLLRTIVQNLLENAIKYSSESDPEVCIAAHQEENGFWLEISDNGIGIPEEMQQKVFDRFFRATTKASGSGLGLFLLRQAVQKFKGRVSLHSAEGQGTTFSVFIPFQ